MRNFGSRTASDQYSWSSSTSSRWPRSMAVKRALASGAMSVSADADCRRAMPSRQGLSSRSSSNVENNSSLLEKCQYTAPFEYPARSAISSMDASRYPRSANTPSAASSSTSRPSLASARAERVRRSRRRPVLLLTGVIVCVTVPTDWSVCRDNPGTGSSSSKSTEGRERMRRIAVTPLATALGTLVISVGGAPAGTREGTSSFAGSCTVKGTVTFNPPVTNTTQQLRVVYHARGTCSGTLNGRSVSDMPVRLHHHARSEGSCLGARTIAPGRGGIAFADGTVILYRVEFRATGTEVDFTFTGRRSGRADGHGSFLTTRTPPSAGLKCAGEGNPELPMDLSLKTTSAMGGRDTEQRGPR